MTVNPWNRALWGGDHNLLQHLINTEAPPTVLQEILMYIYNLYQRNYLPPGIILEKEDLKARINQLAPVINFARSQMDWMTQRICDLAILRFIRKNGGLSIALGAGTSISAGCPSWPRLVRELLSIALEKGHEIAVHDRFVGKKSMEIKRRVVRVEHFTDKQLQFAKKIIDQIDNNSADCEILKDGAQLCADLFKESLFQQITMIIYANTIGPVKLHNVIAKLAQKQKLSLHNVIAPGWSTIINYNFDSLIIEALDNNYIPYYYFFMRNGKCEQYKDSSQKNPDISLNIVYLHGFTPRKPFFNIAGIDFVFSTSQYADIYGDKENLIDIIQDTYLKDPSQVVLYVGCSFTDSEMNNLLKEAIEKYPFRFHYALLKLPEEFLESRYEKPLQIEYEEVIKLSEKYQRFGIQPIWFYDYSEIPDLLLRLT